MNLKKSILSFMAAGAILAGGFGSVAAQQADSSDTNSATVSITSGGEFDVQFCSTTGVQKEGANFGTVQLTSDVSASVTKTDMVVICWKDSQQSRGHFNTLLSAGPFVGTNNANNTISNTNLKPSLIGNPGQGQWGPGVASISGRTSTGGVVNTGGATQPTADWGLTTFGDGKLLVARSSTVGRGTAGQMYVNQGHPADARADQGSYQYIELELTVPATTVPDTYSSTLTVEVFFTNP